MKDAGNVASCARALNILITAGGTSEKIDGVRRITNSGTGSLGAHIAEAYASSGRNMRIVYLCPAGAVRPAIVRDDVFLETIIADGVNGVKDAVCKVCAEVSFDVIVQSMALGDYAVKAVSDASLAADSVIQRLSLLACGDSSSPEEAVRDALLSPPDLRAGSEAKISSDREDLIVVLERAPKIISLYRSLAPEAVIVGFKLLSGANEDELVRAGHELLLKNNCDFVLANDMRTVQTNLHEGLLISRGMSYERALGKANIAALIVNRTLELV